MLVQWLTFAVMVLIQSLAAVWVVSAIRTALDIQGREIQTLRDRWHALASKIMAVEQHEKELVDHESRIRALELLRGEVDRLALEAESVRVSREHGFTK